MRQLLRRLLTVIVLLAPSPLRAQTPDSVTQAAATITAAEVARHLGVLTADSMRPRATPSPALERTARYVADEFQRLGLKPGAPVDRKSAWMQRYRLPGQQRVDPTTSSLTLMFRVIPTVPAGQTLQPDTITPQFITVSFANAAYFSSDVGDQRILPRQRINYFGVENLLGLGKPVAVVAGRQTIASVRRRADELRDKTVLYVPHTSADSTVRRQIVGELYAVSQGVMILSSDDSVSFAAARAAHQQPVALVDDYLRTAAAATPDRPGVWAIAVWVGAVRPFLTLAGLDLARLRADTAPTVQVLPPTAVFLSPEPLTAVANPDSATNVVGVVEGRDPKLKEEYVVVAVPMDGDGGREKTDNSAGVAGLLALAKAFNQPGARPRRSVLLLTASGGAHDDASGVSAFTFATGNALTKLKLVGSLTLDHIDRVAGDSVWIDGVEDVTLTVPPAWVVGAHPELAFQVVDQATMGHSESEHVAFMQAAVPSLSVHTSDTNRRNAVGKIALDTAHIARVSQLAFYIVREIADAERAPGWSTEGRRRLNALLVP